MTVIDLGERPHDDWQPPALGFSRTLRRWWRQLAAAGFAVTVLVGLPASSPAAPGRQSTQLTALAGAEEIEIVDGVAIAIVRDEVIAADLATGAVLWRRADTSARVADRAAGLLTVVTFASAAHTSLVEARSGAVVAQSPGLPVLPAVGGVQVVGAPDGEEIVGLSAAGSWRRPWERHVEGFPVYAQGRSAAQALLFAADGALNVLDLRTGELRALGRLPAGERPIGLFDGLVQTIRGGQGSTTVTLFGIGDAGPAPAWSERLGSRFREELFPCGLLLCATDGTGTVAHAPTDGRLVWAAGRFAVELPGDGDLMAGRLVDPMRPEQAALLDVRTGVVVARLGKWLVAPSSQRQREVVTYLPGGPGRAWLGVLDLSTATVRPTVHLTESVEACAADDGWVVCRSGIAEAPPFAVDL